MSSAAPGMRLVWCALYLIRLCHMPNVHFVRITNTTHREDLHAVPVNALYPRTGDVPWNISCFQVWLIHTLAGHAVNCKNACKPIKGKSEGFIAAQAGHSRPAGHIRAGNVISCALTLSTGMRKAALALQHHQAGATCVQTAGLVEDRQRTGKRAATAEGCNQVGAELLQGQQAIRSAPL